MTKLRKAIGILIVLVFSFSVIGCGSKSVAVVNGEKIAQTELDKQMTIKKAALEQQGASFTGQQGEGMIKALEQQTLEEMIQQKLLMQAAKKEGLEPTKAEIDKELASIKSRFGGDKAFNDAIKQFKYTVEDVKEKLAFDLAYTKLFDKVTADVKVTEKDAKDYYDKNKEYIKDPIMIEARAILVKFDDPQQQAMQGQPPAKVGRTQEEAEKLAKDIIKQLDNGTSFNKLAEEKSEDDRFKADGGLVKDAEGKSLYVKGTVMPAEFDQAAEGLKAGSYTKEPVKTSQGYYIIKLETLKPEKQLTFEEAKDRMLKDLPLIRKQEKFNEYFTNLQKSAKIENNLTKDAEKSPAGAENPSTGTQDPSSDSGQLPPNHPTIE